MSTIVGFRTYARPPLAVCARPVTTPLIYPVTTSRQNLAQPVNLTHKAAKYLQVKINK